MWKLIRKDLILDRRTIGLNFVMYLIMVPAFMIVATDAPSKILAAWAAVIGAMVPLSLVAREDKFHTAPLTCSLPVNRNEVVRARFVGGWLLAVAVTGTVIAACYVVALAGLASTPEGWGAALLVAFITLGFTLAGLVPFTMRFGLAGLIGFLVALQVLGIVAFLSAVLVGGHGTLQRVIGSVVGGVRGLGEMLGPGGFVVFLIVAVVLANIASFLLSRWIFIRREL